MKRILFILAVFTMTITTSCKSDKKGDTTVEESIETIDKIDKEVTSPESYSSEKNEVQLKLESKSGSSVTGTVNFSQEDNIVTMVAMINGLSEGTHAIHIHEKADCSSDDGKSAGGHWNPTNQPHGKWGSSEGFHKGDIGNLNANANGIATLTMTTEEWCIGCDDPNKNILGKAIIVHEGTDDFKTQPTGNAGGRVSCGGIIE